MNALVKKSSFLFVFLLFVAARCELPDLSQYAELTKEMSQSIKLSANQTIDFLEDANVNVPEDSSEIDDLLMGDLDEIIGRKKKSKTPTDYVKQLRKDWKTIFATLEELVNYTSALGAVKESGEKGKESFGKVADGLTGLAKAAGLGTVSDPISALGKTVYDKIATIRASKSLEKVITESDVVIQAIAKKLDGSLTNMIEINNVAESENLLASSSSVGSERLRNYFNSLIEKEKVCMEKLTLINIYDNGDRSALIFFVNRDPQSLDKLGLKSLSEDIKLINENGSLTPKGKLDAMETLTKTKYKNDIDKQLTNQVIINGIKLNERLKDIQSDLLFVCEEKSKYQDDYDKILQTEKDIHASAKTNRELIEKSQKALAAWAKNHGNLKDFFKEKMKLNFASLQQYVEDVQELGTLVKNLKQK